MTPTELRNVILNLQVTADRLIGQRATVHETWEFLLRDIAYLQTKLMEMEKAGEHQTEGQQK